MTKRPQIIHLLQPTESPVSLRALGQTGPFGPRRDDACQARFEVFGNERVLEDTVSENGDQGSEAGNAGTDDGYIRLESRPDTEIDAFPFTKSSVISDYHVQSVFTVS